MTEIWNDVPGHEGYYQVSDQGNVRSVDRVVVDANGRQMNFKGVALKPQDNNRGYFKVSLSAKLGNQCIHSLVAAAFIGPRPDGMDVCHNDGDRRNNYVSNLRYATRKENLADMADHGTLLTGEKSSQAKLTESDVRFIRSCPHSNRELSDHFLISNQQISRIRTGKRWGHLK